MKTLFVAATGQHVGKTTSTLGIVANLKERGIRTGYCKPVGQKYVNVEGMIADKDAVLFSKVIGFNINPDWHSPVILGPGATSDFLDDPNKFQFEPRIREASQQLEANCDLVVYEGTGHPGVGSVVNLSNAAVAKMLDAGVIMIVEGGIGRTIDKLALSLALFREQNVPILGVIVNKVIVEKKDRVEYFVGKKLKQMGIPLLGVLPYDQTLSFPIMATVCRAVAGKILMNEAKLANPVADIIPGSLVEVEEFEGAENILLVVSHNRFESTMEKIKQITKIRNMTNSPLSGIIITGDGRKDVWFALEKMKNDYVREHQIPVISTSLDTFGSVVKISRIEVKINIRTPWKVRRAIELIKEHVNLDIVLNQLG